MVMVFELSRKLMYKGQKKKNTSEKSVLKRPNVNVNLHTPIRADMYIVATTHEITFFVHKTQSNKYQSMKSANLFEINYQCLCVCVLLYWQDTELRFVIHAHIIACF